MDIRRTDTPAAPGLPTLQPSTVLMHATELPKDSITAGIAPKTQSSVVTVEPSETLAVEKIIARMPESKPEDNPQAPSQSSQISKTNPSVQPSDQSSMSQHKVAPSEGIASIAQSLAVGSSKRSTIPNPFVAGCVRNPFVAGCDHNPSYVDLAAQRQIGGIANMSTNLAQSPFSGPTSYQPLMPPGRNELGSRAVMMVRDLLKDRVSMRRVRAFVSIPNNTLLRSDMIG